MQKVIENTRCFVNHKLGYDLVRFSGQHNLRSHLHKVINEYQIETIIDVGANEGQFAFCAVLVQKQFFQNLNRSPFIESRRHYS